MAGNDGRDRGSRPPTKRGGGPTPGGRPPGRGPGGGPGGGKPAGGSRGGPPGGRTPTGKGGGRGRRDARPAEAPRPTLTKPGNDLLYGRNAVAEAFHGRRTLERLFIADGVKEDERLRRLEGAAAERGVPVERVPRAILDDLFPGGNHQGVALAAGPYQYVDFDDLVERSGTVLVLDHLQDPQNFGTLLRAAEASGAAGVVIAQDRAVEVTPSVVNASAGAVELLAVAQVPNIPRALAGLKERGRWAIGLDTGDDAVDLLTTDLPLPAALVVGAEGGGLSPLVRRSCDLIASLPMRGRIESLNAATAGAIALYDLVRREAAAGA